MRWFALAAIALPASGCVVVDSMLAVSCIDHVHEDVPFATPNDDAALQFKIDRCRLDHDACAELCTLALERSGVGNPVATCHVDFSATEAIVHVTFDTSTNAPGCNGSQTSGPGGGGGSGGGPVVDAGIVMPGPDFDF